jgi:hypothetical protein
MKKILTILFTCTSIFLSAQTCLTGGVTFTTQQQIDDFPTDYPGCTQILGNVTITSGPEITNLNGLSAVTSIEGNLFIAGNWDLPNLAGLNALASVGGYLEFQSNGALTSLNGLNALHSVGGELRIYNNQALTNLSALNSLTSIGGTLSINENVALTSLAGLDNINPASFNNLIITNNSSALTFCGIQSICDYLATPTNLATIYGNGTGCNTRPEVEATCMPVQCPTGGLVFSTQQQIDDFPTNYPGCTVMPYSITITGSGIMNLNGLNQLESVVGNITISAANGLTSLTGLGGLNSIGGNFAIESNYALSSFSGLGALNSVGGTLMIGNNQSLQSLSGLVALSSIGNNLIIQTNASLVNLNGLESLTSLSGGLHIVHNQALVNISALASITSVGGSLGISGTSLISVAGLESLTSIGGNMLISQNGALTDISAFTALNTVSGSLRFLNNAALTSLTGLENIEISTITNLELINNGSLAICDIANICDYLSTPSNPATISGNATGCASRPEVEAACAPVVLCPTGDLVFSTQQQIDDFTTNYPGCTVMPYSITIQGADITNLNGLSQLTLIGENLGIFNTQLADLSGLSAITSIGGYLNFSNNGFLTNLSGLGALTSIGGDFICFLNGLTNFSGMESLESIGGGINITSNGNLTNLEGLGALTSIGGDLRIYSNVSLSSLSGLGSLTTIGGAFEVLYNSLTSFSSLGALTSVGGHMDISNNSSLVSISGLGVLSSIGGHLTIANNSAYTGLLGLQSLSTINGNLLLLNNGALASLSDLNSLTSINGGLGIAFNSALTTLSGLENIAPGTINDLYLSDNANLSVCDMANICDYLSNPTSLATIFNNATGCATRPEVQTACTPVVVCPTGDLVFSTQQQIDDFPTDYPGCTVMPYSITISGAGITNLNGLGQLVSIAGDLSCYDNPLLTNFAGMSALTTIGGHLNIAQNVAMANLDGLNGLTSVGSYFEIYVNPVLANVTGLSSLTTVGSSFNIYESPLLSSLSGLESLTSVNEIGIEFNDALTSLAGLENVNPNSIGYLQIQGNTNLSICDLDNICTYLSNPANPATIGGNAAGCADRPAVEAACATPPCPTSDITLTTQQEVDNFQTNYPTCTVMPHSITIQGNDIVNLNGLSQLVSIGGNLEVLANPSLTNLAGLNGLTSMGGHLWILGNSALTSLVGLDELASIGGQLHIGNNGALTSLAGLTNLNDIGGYVAVDYNSTLPSLSGLENIPASAITFLYVGYNPILSICDLPNICDYLSVPTNSASITNNATGCATRPEVEAACVPILCPTGPLTLNNQFQIDDFPTNYPGCTVMPYSITIQGPDVTNLDGLSQLVEIEGNLDINNTTSLANLSGLDNLTSVGGRVWVISNSSLTALTGLNSLTSIGTQLFIANNGALTNMTALTGISAVSNNVAIYGNSSLASLSGLNNLSAVGGNLYIGINSSLTSLTALSSLAAVNGSLEVSDCPALTSLTGLDNVNLDNITQLNLVNNGNLSICDLSNICDYLSNAANPANISGNASGCATRPEVEAACNVGVYTFTGAGGAGWSVAASWSGGVVPPNPLPVGEEIIIAANCTQNWYTTIDGSITINSGVTLTISNAVEDLTFTVNGTGHNYGTINANDENLVIGSAGSFINYSGASILATTTLGGIENNGQFSNEAGATVNIWGCGNSGIFTNNGTSTIGFGWTNLAGGILNNSGNITNSNGSGFLNNVGGAIINLTGGIISFSCGISGTGAMALSGGDLRLLRNPVSWPSNFNWTSGIVTLGGIMSIDAGVTITVPSGGTLTRQNGNAIFINSGGSLVVNGTFIPHAGGFSVQNGGIFEISSGSSVSFSLAQLSNSGTVANAGTLTLIAGVSQNYGTLNNSGILNINGYFVTSGTLSNSGTVNNNGSLELNTNPAQFPTGTFNWNSGSIVRIGVNGQYTLDNTLIVPSGCGFVVQSTAPFNITAGGQLENNGSTTLNGGATVNDGVIINNSSGNLTLQSGSLNNNGTLTNTGFLTLRSTFTNAGTITQNGGELYYCIPISSLLPGGNFNWNGGGLGIGRPSVCTCTATLNAPFTLPPGRSLSLHPSSSLINNSSLLISSSGSFGVWGTLTNNSVIENNGFISPFFGSNFTNNGLIKGTGSQQGTVGFTNGPNGTVAPGASPGCYGFLQGFTNQGTLSMEIDGTTFCSQYDRLANSGTTTLGGTLNLTFSITPTIGQTFTIITSSSIVGSFSTINVTPSNINVSQSGGEVIVASVLPVELIAFSAEKFEKYVQLHWVTASETNNRGFEVQRSDDGDQWQEIGFVNGSGTSTSPQHYDFYDKDPAFGMNYYRLRQMDFDGQESYSDIVVVRMDGGQANLRFYPNPATAAIEIQGIDLSESNFIQVVDATGKHWLEQPLQGNMLDVSALPPGIYTVLLTGDNEAAPRMGRLVVQR